LPSSIQICKYGVSQLTDIFSSYPSPEGNCSATTTLLTYKYWLNLLPMPSPKILEKTDNNAIYPSFVTQVFTLVVYVKTLAEQRKYLFSDNYCF
jgi:hypothetical protein